MQVTLLCFFIKLWANKKWTRQWAEIPTKISPLINLYMETEATGEIVFPFRILKQGWLVFNSQHLYFRGRKSTCNAGASGAANWIPQLRRSPGEGNSNPLQHSCLGNPMVREAWCSQKPGYSPWGRKESDVTEQLHTYTSYDTFITTTQKGEYTLEYSLYFCEYIHRKVNIH